MKFIGSIADIVAPMRCHRNLASGKKYFKTSEKWLLCGLLNRQFFEELRKNIKLIMRSQVLLDQLSNL